MDNCKKKLPAKISRSTVFPTNMEGMQGHSVALALPGRLLWETSNSLVKESYERF